MREKLKRQIQSNEGKLFDEVDDVELKFAVIMTKYKNKLVFCKHRERETYEMPGGHREAGETINGCRTGASGGDRRN